MLLDGIGKPLDALLAQRRIIERCCSRQTGSAQERRAGGRRAEKPLQVTADYLAVAGNRTIVSIGQINQGPRERRALRDTVVNLVTGYQRLVEREHAAYAPQLFLGVEGGREIEPLQSGAAAGLALKAERVVYCFPQHLKPAADAE